MLLAPNIVLCILNAVEEMVEGIDDCGFDTICVLEATFDGIIDICGVSNLKKHDEVYK